MRVFGRLRLSPRLRTIGAAVLGIAVVAVPTGGWIAWHLGVEVRLERQLALRLGRPVRLGSAWPRPGGLRLEDVTIFGAPPFEKVPLLQAGAVDVDAGWRAVLAGRVEVRGLLLHRARVAVVRDAARGTDNLGDLVERALRPRPGAGAEPAAPPGAASGRPTTPAAGAGTARPRGLPVRIDGGSLELAYRDRSGLRWVARIEGLDGALSAGSGTITAARVRIETSGAAAELSAARFEVAGGVVRRAEAGAGRLALAGAADLVGDAHVVVERAGAGWSVQAQARRLEASADVDPDGLRLRLYADKLPLAPLRPLGDPRGLGTGLATLSTDLSLRVRPHTDALGLEGRVRVADLAVTHPRVTSGAITGVTVEISGSLVAAPRAGRVAVDQAHLGMGDLSLWLRGAAEDLRQSPRIEVDARLDELDCQALLESFPPGLAPSLEGARASGRVSARGKLRLDGAHLADLVLDGQVRERCTVDRDPPRADVVRLRAPVVTYRRVDADGRSRQMVLGAPSPDWRPLAAISPHLQAAFLTAEDARFYSHSGFDPPMIRRALIEDLEKGRFTRGASTISQQTVKNLLLDHGRTFSRKLQETLLTWRLEQVVPKRRILELYLNAIELGPGTFGVRQGARRYFGKEPRALSPLEAAHLASVAPNPRGYWTRFHKGPIADDWMEKLYDLLGMMHRSHRLSDEDFAQAMTERLRLRPGG